MAVYNLGRICPAWKGNWDSATQYYKMDVVFHGGNSYIALADNKNSEPSETNTNWSCIAKSIRYSDMSSDEQDAMFADFMRSMSTSVYVAVQNYVQTSLQDPSIIQTWLQFVTMSQTDYDNLADKSGIYFVYA